MTSDIATLPAFMGKAPLAYPLSVRTGEPRHPVLLVIASLLCWLSVPVTIVAYARWWIICSGVDGFHYSAWLLERLEPPPVSWLAVIMVMVVGLITALMVIAAGIAGYNAWKGQLWVRFGVWGLLGVTGLSYLLNWWFMVAMIPLALGGILLLFPPYGAYCQAVEEFHAVPKPVVPTSGIKYGPQPLIGSRF
ncbi:MAG: hypothetical protein FWG15_03255 [Propionibacteriaceae bacterium]|jgi:hypothetical protein|nr:hypothetical protein [Propionibacteriaceae bacterium]